MALLYPASLFALMSYGVAGAFRAIRLRSYELQRTRRKGCFLIEMSCLGKLGFLLMIPSFALRVAEGLFSTQKAIAAVNSGCFFSVENKKNKCLGKTLVVVGV